ncbi:uncharacterized protein LOC119738655 [Patiria miniata]|uniref:Farnesoic acid O-methyl transferase domain-containing protein n=1 Tax=Patiria miniata TaxID=46514 RepID=A0A914B1X2_PATMI|nr:uncharacterized protein LOC119738655 [Patiria miniata]
MATLAFTAVLLSLACLAEEVKGMDCTIMQEPDADSDFKYRWVIPVRDPCLCTKVWLGGMSSHTPIRPFKVEYRDTFLHSGDIEEVQNWLNCSCSFFAPPTNPSRFTFILRPLSMPFRLNFKLKSAREPFVALAEGETEDSIFAEINIGGWGNSKSVIRPCQSDTGGACDVVQVAHNEQHIVTDMEYRPFWIDYKGGVVKVGKGGQEEAFLEWDAGAHYNRVPTHVRVGIASWHIAPSYFKFFQYC